MRLLVFLLCLFALDVALSLEREQRRCRMQWDSVDQYPVLAEVCKDRAALRALMAADAADRGER